MEVHLSIDSIRFSLNPTGFRSYLYCNCYIDCSGSEYLFELEERDVEVLKLVKGILTLAKDFLRLGLGTLVRLRVDILAGLGSIMLLKFRLSLVRVRLN
jgi:hypothetical protein